MDKKKLFMPAISIIILCFLMILVVILLLIFSIVVGHRADYSSPEKIMAKTPTIASIINDSKLAESKGLYVSNGYAYVVTEDSLVILDVSSPDSSNPVVGYLGDNWRLTKCSGIYVSGDRAYIISHGDKKEEIPGNLTIVDISDPRNPKFIGLSVDPLLYYPQDVYVSGDYAYVTVSYPSRLIKINVSDPENPKFENMVSLESSGHIANVLSISGKGNYLYVASGSDNEILAIDTSNPDELKITGRAEALEYMSNIHLSGNYLYAISWEYDALAIIDITDQESPKTLSLIKGLNLEKAYYISVSGEYAYIIEGSSELTIVDVSDPEKPFVVESIPSFGLENIGDLFIEGRYAYLLTPNTGNFLTIDLKGEIVFSPERVISVFLNRDLNIKEGIASNTYEGIFFLKDGNIWVASLDLIKKYELVDNFKDILYFHIFDGSISIYFYDEDRIWKRNSNGSYHFLGETNGIDEEFYREVWQQFYVQEISRGRSFAEIHKELEELEKGILGFHFSPDKQYIAFEQITDYTSCCNNLPTIPVTTIWIMRNDGTEMVEVDKPQGSLRPIMNFVTWTPDNKIIFYLQNLDEFSQGSPYYEVGIDGDNPKLYSEILDPEEVDYNDENISNFTIKVLGAEPIYSPSKDKVAWIENDKEVRLKDIKTGEVKTIYSGDLPFTSAFKIISWSEYGNLILLTTDNEVNVFDNNGNDIYSLNLGSETVDSAILSPDNKYIGGVYTMRREKTKVFFFIDLSSFKIKEFKLPENNDFKRIKGIYPQFFFDNNFYYLMETEGSKYELWFINTDNWINYKLEEDVIQVIKAL